MRNSYFLNVFFSVLRHGGWNKGKHQLEEQIYNSFIQLDNYLVLKQCQNGLFRRRFWCQMFRHSHLFRHFHLLSVQTLQSVQFQAIIIHLVYPGIVWNLLDYFNLSIDFLPCFTNDQIKLDI